MKMAMNEPLISILVPIFNVEKYVSECVESIIQQDYKNIQIILVDDGSTDKSGELCDQFASRDIRIEVIHQENKGLVSARKSGLKKAKGDYIGFVDGDDYIAPSMYGVLLKKIVEYDADFVHSGFVQEGKKVLNFKPGVMVFNSRRDREEFIKRKLFLPPNNISPSIWSKLFKAEFIKECYSRVPDNAQYGEDLINLCICLERCSRFVLVGEAHYYYRYRGESITNEIGIKSFRNIFRYYANVCNVIRRYDSYEELESFLINELCNKIMYKFQASVSKDFQLARYVYANPEKLQGKRIIIYGAGAVGRDYYAQISRYTECCIIAWVDANPERYDYPYIKLSGLEVLDTAKFDILIIAVKGYKMAEEIRTQLACRGIENDKIIWSEPKAFA